MSGSKGVSFRLNVSVEQLPAAYIRSQCIVCKQRVCYICNSYKFVAVASFALLRSGPAVAEGRV